MPGRKIILVGLTLIGINVIYILIDNKYEIFSSIFGLLFLFVGLVIRALWVLRSSDGKKAAIEIRSKRIKSDSLIYLLSNDPLISIEKVQGVIGVTKEIGEDYTQKEFEDYMMSSQLKKDLDFEINEIRGELTLNQKKEIIEFIELNCSDLGIKYFSEVEEIKYKLKVK